jgi:hypothetical protein
VTLRNNYDPSKPKAIGLFGTHDLRRKCTEDSHSNHILHGGKERRNFTDAPLTNAQLRDKAIRLPEAKAQQNLKKTIFRSRIMDAISRGISAYYEPVLTLVSSAYTPDKPGKPRTEARHTAKVSIFSRDRPGLVAQYEPLAQALNADPDITFDSLDGNAIVNSLQKAGFNLFFAPDEWPGETYFARHREMLVAIESGATPTS